MTITPITRPVEDEALKRRIIAEIANGASLTLADYAERALFDYGWPVERLHRVFNTAARITFSVGTKGGAA